MVETGAKGRRILAVDDELQILRALKLVLRSAGYVVVTAANMEEALDAAAVSPTDAAIVDLLLPDGDGIELCRQLREWTSMPIIVLSAVGDEDEKVRALRSGADDYVTKPFGPQELVARLEAVLRRTAPEPDQSVFAAHGLEVDLAAHVVRRDGEVVHLTPTEFELLRFFMRNPRRVLSKTQILDRVWNYDFGGQAHVVELYISYLRKKIDAGRPPLIHTVRGVGYVLKPGN